MLLKLLLHLNVLWVRSITGLSSIVDRYLIKPIPPQASFQLKIPAHTSKQKGFITLLFYTPAKSNFGGTPRPVIINFHGGGWIFGTPQLDARWAARVVHEGAVLISVGYRLAPSYPYPTPIQDCVDAIKWVYANAEKYNLDRDKIALSGFSAGGNMVFAAAMMLHAKREHDIKLQAIVSFYPLLDRTKTREEKYEGNGMAEAKVSTPKSWDKLYADCYLGTEKVDFTSPYLSPGLASDELLRECLPKNVAVFTCTWDALFEEGEVFRERLISLGKIDGGGKVEGVTHAFDKFPGKIRHPKMDQMYGDALQALRGVII